MVRDIATQLIFGKPAIMWGGLGAFFLLLFTATVGALNYKGIRTIPFQWHPRLAIATIVVAVLHAVLGLSLFFGF